ncbi:hypothetical protein [uncultured Dokdonia sp.]|uniref:hypothetical protein n=1 Tax=uncultured Dokdonia sp. TaxID=575653 RepID=UPI00261EFF50|nr:hypothetical protein [uncultured Dokdonia sp.]
MENNQKGKKLKMKLSNIPIDSSLGLLAVGDVAFTEWRKVKTANNAIIDAKSKEDK